MSPVASKLSDLWQFLYTKVRRNLNFTEFCDHEISLNRSPKFCVWAQHLSLNNTFIVTWGLSPLHHWFLWKPPPPPIQKICTPSVEGLTFIKIYWISSNFIKLNPKLKHVLLLTNRGAKSYGVLFSAMHWSPFQWFPRVGALVGNIYHSRLLSLLWLLLLLLLIPQTFL